MNGEVKNRGGTAPAFSVRDSLSEQEYNEGIMKKDITGPQATHPNKHVGEAQEPHRVAARMEGVVKNTGTKKDKKPKQD